MTRPMKSIFLAFLLLPLSLFAELKVAAAYPYIGELTEKIGGDHVSVNVLAPGSWDPHFVVPRPSLIAKLRRADALIINGGELEIGWLPALVDRANNANIRGNGRLELAQYMTLIQIPNQISRANGDIHPGGNPHFHLDPNNILIAASTIATFLSQRDPDHATDYAANLERFSKQWRGNMERWKQAMASAAGKKVVQYHNIFNYFLRAYNIQNIGNIEPLPGIPPSTKHTLQLIQNMKQEHPYCILHDVYHPVKTGEFIASKTGVPLKVMPHDVDADERATDLKHLFDTLVGTFAP